MAEPEPLHATDPRTIALVVGVFLVVIGFPAGLFLFSGQPKVAAGIVVVFALMVSATAYGLRKAAKAEREDPWPR